MIALVSTPERRLFLIALLTRLVPAALIWGSDDVTGWETWGRAIVEGANPYHTRFLIGWPPLWLPFAAMAVQVSDATHLPFNLVAKMIPISADIVLTFILYSAAAKYGRAAYATALAYALNPVSIYISAVHGQFDAVPALCLTVAIVLERSAAWIGAGAAFKTWPLFALPAHIAPLRHRAREALIAIAIFAVALLLPAPFAGWHAVMDAVRYRGAVGWWGLSSIGHVPPAVFYVAMALAALFVLIVKPPPARGALLLLLTFYVTTPGFGIQYLIWIVPIALLVDARNAIVYSILAGLLMTWEALARPYTGYIGETLRILPHLGYPRAYGSDIDRLTTAMGRLFLWAFVCYWWLVTLLRTRAQR